VRNRSSRRSRSDLPSLFFFFFSPLFSSFIFPIPFCASFGRSACEKGPTGERWLKMNERTRSSFPLLFSPLFPLSQPFLPRPNLPPMPAYQFRCAREDVELNKKGRQYAVGDPPFFFFLFFPPRLPGRDRGKLKKENRMSEDSNKSEARDLSSPLFPFSPFPFPFLFLFLSRRVNKVPFLPLPPPLFLSPFRNDKGGM